jgi:hypothetical protein
MASGGSDPSLSLADLFGASGIAADANGDGYADRLKVGIGVEAGLTDAGVWAQVLNLAARLAGEVTALDLAVVKSAQRVAGREAALVVHRPTSRHSAEAELRRSGNQIHIEGRSTARMAEVLFSLAVHDGMPGRTKPRWTSMRTASGSDALEAFDRHGKRVGRFRLSVVRQASGKPGAERFDLLDLERSLYRVPADSPRVKELCLSVELPSPAISFQVGLALANAVVAAALEATRLELPVVNCGPAPAGGVVLRVEETAGKGARLAVEKAAGDGVVVHAAGDVRSLPLLIRDWIRVGFAAERPAAEPVRRLRGRIDELLATTAAAAPPPGPVAAAAVRRRLSWQPETERLMGVVRRVPPGRGEVRGLALVSRPAGARAKLRGEIERTLCARGYAPAVVVLNAYKPGLSWLREVVQPALAALKRVDRVQIAFRAIASEHPGMEMRSRWLQELYPGPDLLAAALGLAPERVRLSMRSRLRDVYVVTARDRDGQRVYRAGFTPRVSRMPYLPGRSELGWVHPCTGGIFLSGGGRALVDEDVPTDREHFWRFFQESVLPALEKAMAGRIAGGGGLPPAFWEEAAFDVRIPETDERLGIGEERVAPLEALHEDLYFVLLEHFRLFADTHGLPADSQFGRILPRVSTAAPAGRPAVDFQARPFTNASAPRPAASETVARITAVGMEAGRLVFKIEAGERAADVCRAARARGLDVSLGTQKGCCLFRTARPRPGVPAKPRAGRTPAPPLDRRLSMREVGRWVGRLGRLPHLKAWQAGTSWQGRGIWALEAVLAGGGRLVSVARTRLLKPTLLVNARHHANEVSSTNAALRLAWELAATPRGLAALKRVNVAIVPLENADGVATLEELLPGCEGHKLHAARYNALGVEWYADYFLEQPRFPEARVKPLLWRRWLPLLVLDAHGVPSHEWDQPFSGYAPGRFRAYWIPRAFIYAILPFIADPSHAGHGTARDLARAMGRAIGADGDIRRLDRELKGRYLRYARSWEPEVFPPSGGGGLTVLPSDRRLAGTTFGEQRFPVTVSEIVTEVTDEVVDGRLLGLCARAHLTAANGLLGWLGRRAPGRLVRQPTPEGGLVLAWEAGSN